MAHGDLGHDGDAGFVIPLLLAIIIGVFLAGLASVALVHAGTNSNDSPITADVITYDAA